MGQSQALQAHILGLGVPLLLVKHFTALMLLALQGSASGRRRACPGTSSPKHREPWWAAVTAIFLPICALQNMLQELLEHIRALDMNGKEGFPAREWLGSKGGRLGADCSRTQSGCPGCAADTLPAWGHLPRLSLSYRAAVLSCRPWRKRQRGFLGQLGVHWGLCEGTVAGSDVLTLESFPGFGGPLAS